jgi:hypothetical protein
MDKEKSAVENFLSGTTNESMFEKAKDPFEIPLETNEVENQEVEEVKEEKPVPFNKDPKVQRFIEKQIEKRLKDLKPSEPERKQEVNDDDDYYARLIGNDTPEKLAMIKEAKAREERQLQLAEERAFNRLSQKEQEEARADAEAEEELSSAFESIEETYDVDISSNNPQARKNRQEFISFVEKMAPKDRYGEIIDYPDMISAWETFSEIKKSTAQPSRAKELAARGLSRSAETSVKQEKRVDWNAVEEMMDGLKN